MNVTHFIILTCMYMYSTLIRIYLITARSNAERGLTINTTKQIEAL